MHKTNGTPAAFTPDAALARASAEAYVHGHATVDHATIEMLVDCVRDMRTAERHVDEYRAECDALTAKAAALDALVEAATVLFHESNTFEGMRGARNPKTVAAFTAALSAAKLAQVSK